MPIKAKLKNTKTNLILMKIAEIKSRGYNYSFDKFELVALLKCSDGSYIYHRCLFENAEQMYNIKVGDVVE